MGTLRPGITNITGCEDFQLDKTPWKKTGRGGQETREEVTVEDVIQMMEDGMEGAVEEFSRREKLLCVERKAAYDKGDRVRADTLMDQRLELLCAYGEYICRKEEQERKIQEEAEKIRAEAETLSKKSHSDPQVLEAAGCIKNMTEEILEQKERLSQKNLGMKNVTSLKKKQTLDSTQVNETCRDVQVYLRQITTLVEEKILTLPEEVRTKLESFLLAFQRLVAGMWKLLFLVLLLHELEKLLVSLKHDGSYISTKKGRLKYGFEFAAMMALWLSHDVESNPGPPDDKRGCMEWLIRQLSDALKDQLQVKGSLWSTEVADAAYEVGFPSKFFWNNPSGKNKLGNKDSMDTLVLKATELGHRLTSMNCLSPELAPLLHDLSSDKGKDRLVVHCKIENLETAVDALLNAPLSSSQNKRVYQLVCKISKKCKPSDPTPHHSSPRMTSEIDLGQLVCKKRRKCKSSDRIQHLSSTRMTSESEFGQLADNCSKKGNEKCYLETDLLAGNLLSIIEAKKSQNPTLMVQQPLDVQGHQTEQEQALDNKTNTENAGRSEQLSNEFVTLVLKYVDESINDNPSSSAECSSGTVTAEDDVPNGDLIDWLISGSDNIPDPNTTSTTADLSTASAVLDPPGGHSTNEIIPTGMTDAVTDNGNDDEQNNQNKNLATNENNVTSPGDVSMSSQEPADVRNLAASDSNKEEVQEESEQLTEPTTEGIIGNGNDQDPHEEDRHIGNTRQPTGGDLNNIQGCSANVPFVDGEGEGACRTHPLVNDSQQTVSTEKENEHQTGPITEKSNQSNQGDRQIGNTDQQTESDLNDRQSLIGTAASVDRDGGACQIPALDNDRHTREIQARLLDEVKQHFDPEIKKYINNRLAELQAQSALSKFQATTHIQDVAKKSETRHIQSAEEMSDEVLNDNTKGPLGNSAPTSHMGDEDDTSNNSWKICEENLEHVGCVDDSATSSKPSDVDPGGNPPGETCQDDLAASTSTKSRKRKRKRKTRKQSSKRRRE